MGNTEGVEQRHSFLRKTSSFTDQVSSAGLTSDAFFIGDLLFRTFDQLADENTDG